jgi:hypothetical protein
MSTIRDQTAFIHQGTKNNKSQRCVGESVKKKQQLPFTVKKLYLEK